MSKFLTDEWLDQPLDGLVITEHALERAKQRKIPLEAFRHTLSGMGKGVHGIGAGRPVIVGSTVVTVLPNLQLPANDPRLRFGPAVPPFKADATVPCSPHESHIHGKEGATLRFLEKKYGCQICLTSDGVAHVAGGDFSAAATDIRRRVDGCRTVSVFCNGLEGLLRGKNGATIKRLQGEYRCRIVITRDGVAHITGGDIESAAADVRKLVMTAEVFCNGLEGIVKNNIKLLQEKYSCRINFTAEGVARINCGDVAGAANELRNLVKGDVVVPCHKLTAFITGEDGAMLRHLRKEYHCKIGFSADGDAVIVGGDFAAAAEDVRMRAKGDATVPCYGLEACVQGPDWTRHGALQLKYKCQIGFSDEGNAVIAGGDFDGASAEIRELVEACQKELNERSIGGSGGPGISSGGEGM